MRTTSGGTVLHVAEVTGGLTFGSAMGVRAGAQVLEVLNAEGRVVMATGTGGRCVKNGCPDGIWNMNYQVVGLAEATAEKWGCV